MAESTSQHILCKQIHWDKPYLIAEQDGSMKPVRKLNKDFAKKLATDIDAEGQLQPIVVIPHPDKPGEYRGVAGEHRWWAMSQVLKRDLIEAKVFTDWDEKDANMASISENLWRNPLEKLRYFMALKAWMEHFQAKFPEKSGSGKAGLKAMNEKPAAVPEGEPAAVTTATVDATPEPPDEAAAEPTQTFPEMVAGATGQSVTSAKMDARIVRAFSSEELEALEQNNVGKVMQYKLSGIKDDKDRGRVVRLIASGMEPEAAMTTIPETVGDTNIAPPPAPEPEQVKAEAAMTDEEWVTTYCAEFRLLLAKYPDTLARFDRDAVFYRHDRDARIAYRAKNKKRLAAYGKDILGPFARAVKRVVHMNHPNNWKLCGGCNGAGSGAGRQCSKCYSAGFSVTQEGPE